MKPGPDGILEICQTLWGNRDRFPRKYVKLPYFQVTLIFLARLLILFNKGMLLQLKFDLSIYLWAR